MSGKCRCLLVSLSVGVGVAVWGWQRVWLLALCVVGDRCGDWEFGGLLVLCGVGCSVVDVHVLIAIRGTSTNLASPHRGSPLNSYSDTVETPFNFTSSMPARGSKHQDRTQPIALPSSRSFSLPMLASRDGACERRPEYCVQASLGFSPHSNSCSITAILTFSSIMRSIVFNIPSPQSRCLSCLSALSMMAFSRKFLRAFSKTFSVLQ